MILVHDTVILDINETLMHNEYLGDGKYTTPCVRPHLKSFISYLKGMGVHLAFWCGAFTAKRMNELVDFILPETGLKKKELVFIFPVLPSCTTRKTYSQNKNKKIVLKPISLVRQILMNSYKHIILFDNNIEKSLGFGQKPGSRWSNDPHEHVEVKSFHTRDFSTDDELHVSEGEGAKRLFSLISELQQQMNTTKSIAL